MGWRCTKRHTWILPRRTINLDGKVDPYAFVARLDDRTSEYLLERNVEYVVDWSGIATWASLPQYKSSYDLLVHDPKLNLAVLRRRLNGSRPDCQK